MKNEKIKAWAVMKLEDKNWLFKIFRNKSKSRNYAWLDGKYSIYETEEQAMRNCPSTPCEDCGEVKDYGYKVIEVEISLKQE